MVFQGSLPHTLSAITHTVIHINEIMVCMRGDGKV